MVRSFTVLNQNYFEILRIKSAISGIYKAYSSIIHKYHGLDSPLPIKLGVDIKGDMEDLSVDLAKCRKVREIFQA